MAVVPTSVSQVYDNLVEFFSNRHGDAPASYTPATDVRARHIYSDAAWMQLRGMLSNLSWMKAIGVALSPLDMLGVSTMWQIANMIWNKKTGADAALAEAAPAKKPGKKAAKKKKGNK